VSAVPNINLPFVNRIMVPPLSDILWTIFSDPALIHRKRVNASPHADRARRETRSRPF
jgi:hypothetical protein